MVKKNKIIPTLLFVLILLSCNNKKQHPVQITLKDMTQYYTEPYRPQFHFSPEEKWMNDPNGMVYHKGVYHLFYQFYPEDIVWGPMHWGHATSEDLIHWEHKPIALFPDEHGYIFSGSAIVDFANTSGFGSVDNPPLVAIFTYHLRAGEEAGRSDYQTQGIAYSLDNGDTWIKYKGNPVIGNNGLKDFRDPKVFWDGQRSTWVMSIVAGDHLQIWNSDNLKSWSKQSEFGKDNGAHGGVWECPDLFKLKVEGRAEEKWVLLISINPGAPNGGSGTQYFVGDFDGEKFSTDQKDIKWLDWGTDNYAGVTYNMLPKDYYGNTYANDPKDQRIFIGWMSNWAYASDTPTEKWRSAMTLPRTLRLHKNEEEYELYNYPIAALNSITKEVATTSFSLKGNTEKKINHSNLNQAEVQFTASAQDFALHFSNSLHEVLSIDFSKTDKEVLLNRANSGKTNFKAAFSQLQKMPVSKLPDEFEVRILLDHSAIEIFLNKGQYVMTAQVFPTTFYTDLTFENVSATQLLIEELKLSEVNSIW